MTDADFAAACLHVDKWGALWCPSLEIRRGPGGLPVVTMGIGSNTVEVTVETTDRGLIRSGLHRELARLQRAMARAARRARVVPVVGTAGPGAFRDHGNDHENERVSA